MLSITFYHVRTVQPAFLIGQSSQIQPVGAHTLPAFESYGLREVVTVVSVGIIPSCTLSCSAPGNGTTRSICNSPQMYNTAKKREKQKNESPLPSYTNSRGVCMTTTLGCYCISILIRSMRSALHLLHQAPPLFSAVSPHRIHDEHHSLARVALPPLAQVLRTG